MYVVPVTACLISCSQRPAYIACSAWLWWWYWWCRRRKFKGFGVDGPLYCFSVAPTHTWLNPNRQPANGFFPTDRNSHGWSGSFCSNHFGWLTIKIVLGPLCITPYIYTCTSVIMLIQYMIHYYILSIQCIIWRHYTVMQYILHTMIQYFIELYTITMCTHTHCDCAINPVCTCINLNDYHMPTTRAHADTMMSRYHKTTCM